MRNSAVGWWDLIVSFGGDRKFKDQPFLIRKSDGAFNYATTNIATLEYGVEHFHADEIVYVTNVASRIIFSNYS
jgi:arginyl-tRNA synthetase